MGDELPGAQGHQEHPPHFSAVIADGRAAPAWQGYYRVPQLRRWQRAIATRFSCRAFLGPADVSQLAALEYAAQRVCLPGTRIALSARGADSLVIPVPLFPGFKGLQQYAVILAHRDLPRAGLLAGVSGEAFVLEAAHLGVGSCWMTGNYRRSRARALAREGEAVMAVIPLGQPLDPHGAKHRTRRDLRALCQDDPAGWPHWAYKAAEAVRQAPSALNRQPWRMSCAGNTLRLASPRFGGIDDGIAVMHMEAAAFAWKRTWRFGQDGRSLLLQAEETHDIA
ncbi:MAG: nitroreductase family protein [Eubacteriales bacterium]|nr:nitroreductase family protein [Eubacteriales bacterium]